MDRAWPWRGPTIGTAPSFGTIYGIFAAALGLGAAVVLLVSISSGHGWGDGVVCTLYLLAASVSTIALGVVFGVPRARTEFVPRADERYASNSNLEQISDWLTKLLVGAGLVELGQLPGGLSSLGAYLGAGMQIRNAAAVSVASVIYGAGVGFVGAYMWTRLRMRLFLETSDRLAAQAAQAEDIAGHLRRQNEVFAETEPGGDLNRAAQSAMQAREAVGTGSIAPVLWVDDVPENNKALVTALRSLDIEVVLAKSTQEALEWFDRRSFGLLITDFGRLEEAGYNPQAGLDLITSIRAKDKIVPIFVFATHRAVARQDELLEAGADLVTSRASVLFQEAARAVTVRQTG